MLAWPGLRESCAWSPHGEESHDMQFADSVSSQCALFSLFFFGIKFCWYVKIKGEKKKRNDKKGGSSFRTICMNRLYSRPINLSLKEWGKTHKNRCIRIDVAKTLKSCIWSYIHTCIYANLLTPLNIISWLHTYL